MHLTILSDVVVSHLFNTLDCPLAANVIWWRFRGCAGEKRESELCKVIQVCSNIYLSIYHYFFFSFFLLIYIIPVTYCSGKMARS